jgi:hypothetical protein
MDEVAIGPRLSRHRAEPAATDRELLGQRAQHGHLLRCLAAHDERSPALDAGAGLGAEDGSDERAEQTLEGGSSQAPTLSLVAIDKPLVGDLPRRPGAGGAQLQHH